MLGTLVYNTTFSILWLVLMSLPVCVSLGFLHSRYPRTRAWFRVPVFADAYLDGARRILSVCAEVARIARDSVQPQGTHRMSYLGLMAEAYHHVAARLATTSGGDSALFGNVTRMLELLSAPNIGTRPCDAASQFAPVSKTDAANTDAPADSALKRASMAAKLRRSKAVQPAVEVVAPDT